MAANRKLQTEIQQVLKKVDEGVELFDEIWGKVYAAEQQSLKEKYENDLKKEIKKLQRLRDQIKSWISSNDIKDKAQLVEARKTIETKMEMFKVCEKDTKTKAYSKEGLAREARIDPKDQLKEEKRSWLNDCLEKLHDLNTLVDGEKEKLSGGKSKLKNKDALEKLDNRIQKHKWHISRIELIIRLLENDELDPSLLDSIKDSLEYYLETATEDDGALGVEHEFDIYEDLELDQYVNNFDVTKPVAETQNVVDTDKDKDGDEREVAKLQVVKVITNNTSTKITDVKTKTDSTPKTETDDVKMPVKSDHDSGEVKQPALATSKVSKAIVVDAKLVEHATNVSPNPVANVQIPAATQGVQPSSATHTSPPTSIPPTTATPPTPQSSTPQSLQIASSVSNNSFMNPELQNIYNMLKQSNACTVEVESDRSSYVPKNFYGGCHNSFPTTPALQNPTEMSNLFDKLPMDSLFFSFYYQQNSLSQFLSAKRLKKTSWRFHKKYTTWFQRHSEPKIATTEYEDGTYIYFDYESGWCQRIKSDFKFEYAFLEDDI